MPEFAPYTGIAAYLGDGKECCQRNKDSSRSRFFQSPGHNLDFSDPWTQYSSILDQSHEPSPADNLFAPGHSPIRNVGYLSRRGPGVIHFQGKNASVSHQAKHPPRAILGSSLDDDDEDDDDDDDDEEVNDNDDDDADVDDDVDDDAIDQPPSPNPVGPPMRGFDGPAQVSVVDVLRGKKKGGRRGKLNPGVKARAKRKRSTKDTCWHCKMLRTPV